MSGVRSSCARVIRKFDLASSAASARETSVASARLRAWASRMERPKRDASASISPQNASRPRTVIASPHTVARLLAATSSVTSL